MANILFVTSYYTQENHTLSINLKKIVNALIEAGNKVTCLTEEYNLDVDIKSADERIVSVPSSWLIRKILTTKQNKMYLYLSRLRALFWLWRYPNSDNSMTNRMKKNIEKELQREKFDCIIAVYRQYSNVQALLNLKKKYPQLFTGVLFFDVLNAYVPFGMPKKFHEWICDKVYSDIFRKMSFCLLPLSMKAEYEKKFEGKGGVIHFFDFPLYQFRTNCNDFLEKEYLELLYAGTLDLNYRNPEPLLKILNMITSFEKNIKLKFYSSGNCVELIKSYSINAGYTLEYCDLVPKTILEEEQRHADILINISNDMHNVIPSKIFELFSWGKPILNIACRKHDYVNTYFDKYPNAFSVKTWIPLEEQQEQLKIFLNNCTTIQLSKETLDEIFYRNMPEYTMSLIMQEIDGR